MKFPQQRWLPIVALILAWQILAWQLPQASESNTVALKKIQDPVVALTGQHVFILAGSKPGDVKKDTGSKWAVERIFVVANYVEFAVTNLPEYVRFGVTRIWLLHCALLL